MCMKVNFEWKESFKKVNKTKARSLWWTVHTQSLTTDFHWWKRRQPWSTNIFEQDGRVETERADFTVNPEAAGEPRQRVCVALSWRWKFKLKCHCRASRQRDVWKSLCRYMSASCRLRAFTALNVSISEWRLSPRTEVKRFSSLKKRFSWSLRLFLRLLSGHYLSHPQTLSWMLSQGQAWNTNLLSFVSILLLILSSF